MFCRFQHAIQRESSAEDLSNEMSKLGDNLYDALSSYSIAKACIVNPAAVTAIIEFLSEAAIKTALPLSTAMVWYTHGKLISLEHIEKLSISRLSQNMQKPMEMLNCPQLTKEIAAIVLGSYIKPVDIDDVTRVCNIGNCEAVASALFAYSDKLGSPFKAEELMKALSKKRNSSETVFHKGIVNWSSEFLHECMLRISGLPIAERRKLILETTNDYQQTASEILFIKKVNEDSNREWTRKLWLISFYSNQYPLTEKGSVLFVSGHFEGSYDVSQYEFQAGFHRVRLLSCVFLWKTE